MVLNIMPTNVKENKMSVLLISTPLLVSLTAVIGIIAGALIGYLILSKVNIKNLNK